MACELGLQLQWKNPVRIGLNIQNLDFSENVNYVRVIAIFLSLLQEYYSDFYAVSPHVFSLNIPNCLRVSSDLLY